MERRVKDVHLPLWKRYMLVSIFFLGAASLVTGNCSAHASPSRHAPHNFCIAGNGGNGGTAINHSAGANGGNGGNCAVNGTLNAKSGNKILNIQHGKRRHHRA